MRKLLVALVVGGAAGALGVGIAAAQGGGMSVPHPAKATVVHSNADDSSGSSGSSGCDHGGGADTGQGSADASSV
jgi:hypothetical protein